MLADSFSYWFFFHLRNGSQGLHGREKLYRHVFLFFLSHTVCSAFSFFIHHLKRFSNGLMLLLCGTHETKLTQS